MEVKPYPQIIALIILFILTIATIMLGYIHGHMSISSVYHSLTNFT